MSAALRDLVDRTFRAVEAKDVAAVLACMAEDVIVIDPHYPTPRMVGHHAVGTGLRWAFHTLQEMRFTPVAFCVSADGLSAAVEMNTAHMLPGGRPLHFGQTFMIDTRMDQIIRLQAYTPYGPPGLGGLLLRLARVQQRWWPGR